MSIHADRGTLIAVLVLTIAGAGRVALADARPSPPVTAPVRITTSVDPRHVTIGTPFRYTMRVEAGPDVELVVPVLGERLGDFEVVDFGNVPHERDSRGHTVVERWYGLMAYEPGDKIVPGPPVQYRTPGSDLQRMDAPDTLIIVDSLLGPDDEAKDVRDIRPPAAVPRDLHLFAWFGAALIGLVAIAGLLYFFTNRRRARRSIVIRPPHDVALHALARLRAAALVKEGRYEEYYVRLSGIVRTYLEERFGLRAPEMTTEEFLLSTQQNPLVAATHRSSLGEFLAEADLVKFARHVPAPEDAERAYRAARQFVEATGADAEVSRAAA